MIIDEDYMDEPELKILHQSGITVKTDGRSAFMHNKFVVVDSSKTWTGSYNFTWTGTHRTTMH